MEVSGWVRSWVGEGQWVDEQVGGLGGKRLGVSRLVRSWVEGSEGDVMMAVR